MAPLISTEVILVSSIPWPCQSVVDPFQLLGEMSLLGVSNLQDQVILPVLAAVLELDLIRVVFIGCHEQLLFQRRFLLLGLGPGLGTCTHEQGQCHIYGCGILQEQRTQLALLIGREQSQIATVGNQNTTFLVCQ